MRHVLLTGPPGVGKTTLVEKLCQHIMSTNITIFGFYTKELRNTKQRVGFDVVSLDGQRSPLARIITTTRGPKVGKYTVDIESFESSVLPLLSTKVEQTQIYVIDEIGKMELFSERFQRKVSDVFACKGSVVLGTIPLKKGHGIPFVESIKSRKDVLIFHVSLQNRNEIFNELLETIMSNFEDSQ